MKKEKSKQTAEESTAVKKTASGTAKKTSSATRKTSAGTRKTSASSKKTKAEHKPKVFDVEEDFEQITVEEILEAARNFELLEEEAAAVTEESAEAAEETAEATEETAEVAEEAAEISEEAAETAEETAEATEEAAETAEETAEVTEEAAEVAEEAAEISEEAAETAEETAEATEEAAETTEEAVDTAETEEAADAKDPSDTEKKAAVIAKKAGKIAAVIAKKAGKIAAVAAKKTGKAIAVAAKKVAIVLGKVAAVVGKAIGRLTARLAKRFGAWIKENFGVERKEIARISLNGLIFQNPTFVLLLGMCPTLATTTSLRNGLAMGLCAASVLACSNLVISLLRKVIPKQIRIASYIVIIATFVTAVDLLMQAFAPNLSKSLGLYIPLIVVNCIILGRAEAFAAKNKPGSAFLDGLFMGLGFTGALAILGAIREILGAGTIWGVALPVISEYPVGLILSPCGGFITLGCLIALVQFLRRPRKGGSKA